MTLTANAEGIIKGNFTVPPNIPTGTKLVQFIGDQGNYGEAAYTARGIITTEERRRVTTITETRQNQTVVTLQRYDPLAQTFTLPVSRHVGGVDLWFTIKGDKKVVVQIRETATGLPTQQVLAEAHIQPNDINIENNTRITWTPIFLEVGTEYALVILTDDSETSVRIAELGKYDALHKNWVTSQPFQVGVLLSSSNASTWTAHQDKDLSFRLLGCRFNEESKVIPLGSMPVSSLSDVMLLANVERPASGTDVEFSITDSNNESLHTMDNQPLALRERITDTVQVDATLKGSSLHSPVLFPGIQAVVGNIQEAANYISRAIEVGSSNKIMVTYESLLPGQASCQAEIQDANGDWQELPLTSGIPIGDGWEERTHVLESFNVASTRLQLTLRGDVANRPRIKSLRIVIT